MLQPKINFKLLLLQDNHVQSNAGPNNGVNVEAIVVISKGQGHLATLFTSSW
jgi:hypothetical protein